MLGTARIFLSRVTSGRLLVTAVATIVASGTFKRYARRRAPAVRTICVSMGTMIKSSRKFSVTATSSGEREASESASIAETGEMNKTAPDSRHSCSEEMIFASPFKYPIRILLSRIMPESHFRTLSCERPTHDGFFSVQPCSSLRFYEECQLLLPRNQASLPVALVGA